MTLFTVIAVAVTHGSRKTFLVDDVTENDPCGRWADHGIVCTEQLKEICTFECEVYKHNF